MHSDDRTANLLGATALAVGDVVLGAAAASVGLSPSGSAALVVLSASPDLQVTELARRIGLSQPAATRLVDALEARRLVERRPGRGRGLEIRLTRTGRSATRSLLDARDAPLHELVALLADEDRRALGDLLATLLAKLYERVGDAELMCRLCNRAACTTDAVCPVGEAERRASH